MASSDEEGEIVPSCVTDYYFVDQNEELVSLDALPLEWSPSERVGDNSSENKFFLNATAEDDRLQKVFKRILAWRFDLSFSQPEIYVFSKDAKWIELDKPRKSFEGTIRTLLVTLHWLHFLKKSPETSRRDLWNYLLKIFISFDKEPSGKDLYTHMPLITEVFERDKELDKCKKSLKLMQRPKEDADFDEDGKITKEPNVIIGMDDDVHDKKIGEHLDANEGLYDHVKEIGEYLDADEGLYDYVCALCDNGGEILCCQGRCLRSFHATVKSGDGYCESLGYMEAQVNAIPTFLCPNCKYRKHQCFVCGMLGSSDNSSGAEVFPCISATCGHFYHAKCVANLLEPANKSQTKELQDRISAGESFTCPVHKCYVCKLGEDKQVRELQLAVCRRCPKVYHRKCLPSALSFKKDYKKNIMQRAWDDLLPNRILIYCMDHEIIRELETPTKDHIKFPVIGGQQNTQSLGLHPSKQRIGASFKPKTNLPKRVEKRCWSDTSNTHRSISKQCSGPNNSMLAKRSTCKGMSKSSMENSRPGLRRLVSNTQGKIPMRSNLEVAPKQNPVSSKFRSAGTVERKATKQSFIKKTKASSTTLAETENRVLALMKESASSFNREDFIRRKKMLASEYSTQQNLEATITEGKVEESVMAIRTALKKLDQGCTIEDAKAVCEPEILSQIFKWKMKLHVYLTPFLHGMRYTSFGRHFTKVDKLKQVVNRLHKYVENGDTIVDFCCGSNDFSLMMKEKLENSGKQCFFRNFDLIMPKNDFCFEQRDWMSVRLEELPTDSQLIMGLNPPFGVKASLANKFINKALQFKPKLVILIVPEETKRLDQLGYPYDLIWKDQAILSGKSFYLPGSIDVNNKQMDDWNLKPPPLYLWSRCDWSARHRDISAMERSETFRQEPALEKNDDPYQDDSGFNVPGDNNTTSCSDDDEEDMCIDMDISSPAHLPTRYKALHEAFGATEGMEVESQIDHLCADVVLFPSKFPLELNHGAHENRQTKFAFSCNQNSKKLPTQNTSLSGWFGF